MSRPLNIRIDENATFARSLTLTRSVETSSEVHPITGATIRRFNREPIDLTGYTIRAQIKDKFTDPTFVENFTSSIVSAAAGKIHLGLSRAQTARLGLQTSATNNGISNSRSSLLGFYDVTLVSPEGGVTRILQGQCYISRGISTDPRSETRIASTISRSSIVSVTSPVTVMIDASAGINYVGIRYYRGGVQITPTAGTVALTRKPQTTNVFQPTPFATLSATFPVDEVIVRGNTVEFRGVPSNIQGADSYQIIVSSSSGA